MSQSGSECSNDDDEVHVEMGDLYGGESGSEMSEEHNIQASSKFPAVETQMSSGALSGRSDLDFTSKLKHSSPIGAVALYIPPEAHGSPLIITGSDDDKAVVWDLKSGKKLRSLKGEHSDRITSIAVFQPKNEDPKILTASWDNSVIVWDLHSGDKVLTVQDANADGINAVGVCLPSGVDSSPLIVAGCGNGSVLVWDFKTGAVQGAVSAQHTSSVSALTVFNHFVITGYEDGTAMVWNHANIIGKKVSTLNGHSDAVTSVAMFVPEAGADSPPLVITGSDDGTAVIWSFYSAEKLRVLEGVHDDSISAVSVCVARDGSFAPIVVTCSHDSTAVLWDLHSGRVLRRLEGGHTDYINAVAVYVPQDPKLAPRIITGGDDCLVMIWELSKGDQVRSKKAFPIESRGLITKLEGDSNTNGLAVYVPADGNAPPLVVTVSDDHSVNVWNLATAQKLYSISEEDGGHDDWVRSVAIFTPLEGSSLPAMAITGCDDGNAIVWDLLTGQKLLELEGEHEAEIISIAVYVPPDGDSYPPVAVTGSSDKSAVVWNLLTGKVMNTLAGEHTDYVNTVAVFTPQRPSLTASFAPVVLTGSDDAMVVVWDLKTGKKLRVLKDDGEDSEVNAVAVFEPFDRSAEPVVITGNEEGTLGIWDLNSGELLRTLTEGHYEGITAVAVFTPQDRNSAPFIVSGSDDYTAVVWDLLSGTMLRTLSGAHESYIMTVAIYAPPDGSTAPLILTGGEDYHFTIWDMNAQQKQRTIEGGHSSSVLAVAVYAPHNPDLPPLVITGGEDSSIIVWELRTGKKLRVLSGGHSKTITALSVYNPGGDDAATPLLISASHDHCVAVWNLLTFKRTNLLKGHSEAVNCVAVYEPTATLVTGGDDNKVIVWNLRSGKKLRTLEEHQEPITALAVYATTVDNNRTLWVFSGSADKTVVVCDGNTGKRIGALAQDGHSDFVTAIAVYSSDSLVRVVTAGGGDDHSIIVWSTQPFNSLRRITTATSIHTLAVFTPPDNPLCPEIVANFDRGYLSVWELKTGEKIRSMEAEGAHSGEILSLAMYAPSNGSSPAMVVTGGDDVVAMIWNYKTGDKVHALEGGHGQDITSVAVFSPQGTGERPLLVTGSHDEVCIVWDIQTGRKVRTLHGSEDSILGLAVYTPTEETEVDLSEGLVIAANESGKVLVWEIHSGDQVPTFTAAEGVKALAIFVHHADDGTHKPMLVCGTETGKVSVFDLQSRQEVRAFNSHSSGVTCVAALPLHRASDNCVLIATGRWDNSIIIHSFPSGEVVSTFSQHKDTVRSIAMHAPDEETGEASHPRIVSASDDSAVLVWDTTTGEVLHDLKGEHDGPVPAVAIYESEGVPLVVTGGGDDALLAVWNMNTGKVIRTLEGEEGVSALAVYEPEGSKTTALVFAATMGRVVDVWADCLIAADYMPLHSMVQQVLDFEISDLATTDTECKWKRIASMAEEFPEQFWLENYSLFTTVFDMAALKSTVRDSFFKVFRSQLPAVVHLLPEVLHRAKGKQKSLLEVCIKDNLPIRGIVLDAWIAALNRPNTDFLAQMLHPSTFFDTQVLLLLGERFPAEFIDFICRIKLIKAHPAAHLNCLSYNIGGKGVITEGMPAKATVDMWTTVAGYYSSKHSSNSTGKINQPVTAFVIPLQGAAGMRMLHAYVEISAKTDNLDIFESDVAVTAFKYAWMSFGLRIHVTTTVRYFLFISLYTASVFLFDRLEKSDHAYESFWAWALQAAVLLGVLFYIYDEACQFWDDNRERILEVKQRLLDSRERAKEQKRKAIESSEDQKESRFKPGQHRKHFSLTGAKMAVNKRPNPAAYSGLRFIFANCQLKLLDAQEAVQEHFGAVGRTIAQHWEDSILRMVLRHFSGFWNLVDLAVIGIVTAGTVVRILHRQETDSSRCILSVGSVVVWFKVLNFMRPFKRSGPLIAMILQIMRDIQYFVLILAVVLTGFSMAFWLISYPDYSLEFGTIQMAFLNTYLYMLGQNISTDFSATASPRLGILLLVMFMFFMMILMLNLLIALMGNSYSKVQEKGPAEWRLGQASMILEQSYMMDERMVKAHERYSSVQVMKYTSLLPAEDREVEVTDAQLSSLKSSLEARMSELQKKIEGSKEK